MGLYPFWSLFHAEKKIQRISSKFSQGQKKKVNVFVFDKKILL
jgi:hypothetical protein